ncbi:VOC family protein [Streptomyces sp. NPDC057636]|uniref:VOC family protein n=1 Tax=Streptomyces sp. NPDC057636 TaxID=3346189 RepID=UPI00369A5CA4
MSNPELGTRLRGLSHLALNCSDMQITVDFYKKLGIPLLKATPMNFGGQHFFFDIGNDDSIAYFYWPDGAGEFAGQPAVAGQEQLDGAMHHVAMKIDAEDVEPWAEHLTSLGHPFLAVVHDVDYEKNVMNDLSAMYKPDKWAVSLYFVGPDGEQLEVCAWLPALKDLDANLPGVGTADERRVAARVRATNMSELVDKAVYQG